MIDQTLAADLKQRAQDGDTAVLRSAELKAPLSSAGMVLI